MASNIKNDFKIGRIRIEHKDLALVNPPPLAPQGMNGMDSGRVKDELTLVEALKNFFGASAANFTQLLTSGEYDEHIALIQRHLTGFFTNYNSKRGNKPLPQANKGTSLPKISQRETGMPLIKFPDGPMI